MATPTYNTPKSDVAPQKTALDGYLFGVPMGDLGWFASVLMGLASGMAAFFFATFLGIITILIANTAGQHWDYAWSYRRVGFPVGLVVMISALAYLGMLWARRIARGASSQSKP